MTVEEIRALIAEGESQTVEFKKSTAQLPRAGETLCAFLNGQGGHVLIGVGANGRLLGQQVSDSTLREVAAILEKIGPFPRVSLDRIPLGGGREVLSLSVPAGGASQHGPARPGRDPQNGATGN